MAKYEFRKAGQKKVERVEANRIEHKHHRGSTQHGDDKYIFNLVIHMEGGGTRAVTGVAWCHRSSD